MKVDCTSLLTNDIGTIIQDQEKKNQQTTWERGTLRKI